MDFFGLQDQARRRTWWLVLFFGISLLALVGAVNTAAWAIATLTNQGRTPPPNEIWPLFALVTLGVISLVGFASAIRMHALTRGGGAAVAHMLGGRILRAEGGTAEDRRLLNVVEEMSLAAALPVPAVYVVPGERSINAFAAGMTPGDAVVAVTEGALDQLDRDELQGVVAHEFSHILNGDMRLNLRLLGLIHGLLILAITGRILLSVTRHLRFSGGRGKNNPLPLIILAIVLAGVSLFVLGWIGWLAGQIIKAAVNRQREYLADAAAVQFTRNPGGLAGALQKIRRGGSRLRHVRAAEVSHLFFARGARSLFASHPPLESRLDRLDPGWRQHPVPEPRPKAKRSAPRPPPAARVLRAGQVAEVVGRLDVTGPAIGALALGAIPPPLRTATREGFAARAAVLAAIADRDPAVGLPALEALTPLAGAPLVAEARRLHALVAAQPPETALSVVLLAVPTLRDMSEGQRTEFLELLRTLVQSDGVVTLHEHALAELVALHTRDARPALRHRVSAEELRQAARDLLSVLAWSEADDEAEARRTFALGARHAGVPEALPPLDEPLADRFHRALRLCRTALPVEKERLVEALAWTVSADGVLSPAETASLRLVVDALGCPLPRMPVAVEWPPPA